MPETIRHLLSVWNPSYADNAMEEHLALLRQWVRRHKADEATQDDVYVWWGKVRSPNRQAPQANIEELRAMAGRLDSDGDGDSETHLYLTDYRSLYVAELLTLSEGELPEAEAAHAPEYYQREGLNCDFWFALTDIRRLVHDDLPAVVEELKRLRNCGYNDRPVSIYGGMVDLPLIVTRPDGQRFFDEAERDDLTGGKLWAEFDAGAGGGVAATERVLRDDMLGDATMNGLEPVARIFLATGEKLFREHRNDPAFDFGPVIMSFAKALEVQVNALLRTALRKLPEAARRARIDTQTVDLLEFRTLNIGEIVHAVTGEKELREGLIRILHQGGWFTAEFQATLDAFREVRNAAVHDTRIKRSDATYWRNRLLGVGCAGDIVDLVKVRLK